MSDDLGFIPSPEKHEDDLGFIPSKSESAPTPSNYWHEGIQTGGKALQALAKFLDVPRALTVGPLSGEVIEGGTKGKKAYEAKDVLNAITPWNLERFPSNYEMMQRVGKQPSELSDIAPALYGTPGKSPWYQPEKGGALDPSTAGFVQAITDPVNLATFGEAGVAKKALESGAARVALTAARAEKAGPLARAASGAGKALDVLSMPVSVPSAALARGVRAVPVAGPALLAAGSAPTEALKRWGGALYTSLIQPVEHEGQKFGKKDVAKTLYDAGIKTPLGLGGKAQEATSALMDARDVFYKAAETKGAALDIDQALSRAQSVVDEWKALSHPNAQKMAQAGQEVLDQYRRDAAGIPATPARTVMEPSSLLDMTGSPVMKERVIPGTPGQPGKRFTPTSGSAEKTLASKQVPGAQYAEFANTPEWTKFSKTLAGGMRDEITSSVARTVGPEAGQAVDELNAAAGNLLGTRRGQVTAQNQGARLANRITTPTGTDTVLAPMGMLGEGSVDSLHMIALKHAADAARFGTMPLGYGLKRLGESNLAGPALNAYLIQKLKEMTDGKNKK